MPLSEQRRCTLPALLSACALSGVLGCGTASSAAARAPHFTFAELPRHPEVLQQLTERPVVLIFEAGEHVPVSFDLESSVLVTPARPQKFEVIASKRFYLLVDAKKHGFRISLDGKDFDHAPKNGFRLGFNVTPEQAHVDVGLSLRPGT